MKKNLLLLPIIACVGFLGSCGDTSSVSSTETTSEQTSTTESFISEPTTIEFLVKTGQSNSGLIDDYIDSFKEVEPNVTIEKTEISTGYSDVETKVINGFSVGDYPDITVAYPDHVANYLSNETYEGEYVVNLEDYFDDEEVGFGQEDYFGDQDESDFVEAFIEEGQNYVREGTYSLPFMNRQKLCSTTKLF
jgi:ABC-type glycerol-3-phosphate transport system substrate-binding protein